LQLLGRGPAREHHAGPHAVSRHDLLLPEATDSYVRPPEAAAFTAGARSELVVERVGVCAVRANDDLALAADPCQVAGPGRLDDLPDHPRDAVRAAGVVLEHEAALLAVQGSLEPLHAHVRRWVLGVNSDDVRLAVAGQVPVERLRDVGPCERYPLAVVVRRLRVEVVDVERAFCSAHTGHSAVPPPPGRPPRHRRAGRRRARRDQPVSASATSPRPIPSIQMSLLTATPAWLGQMLPGLRSAGVRAYMVMRLPENPVSAAPARAFGTTGAMRAVLTAILLPEAGLQIVYHGPVTVPTGPDGPDDPACPADVAGPAGAALAAGACGSPPRLRVDAERNRAALLAAAREVFAEQGLEAPLEEVALRAGVGIATLYRRFPNRRQLVAAALVDTFAQYAEAAERALAV